MIDVDSLLHASYRVALRRRGASWLYSGLAERSSSCSLVCSSVTSLLIVVLCFVLFISWFRTCFRVLRSHVFHWNLPIAFVGAFTDVCV